MRQTGMPSDSDQILEGTFMNIKTPQLSLLHFNLMANLFKNIDFLLMTDEWPDLFLHLKRCTVFENLGCVVPIDFGRHVDKLG